MEPLNGIFRIQILIILYSLTEMALPSGSRHDDGDGGDAHPGSPGDYYNSLVAAVIVGAFILVALVVVTALYLRRTTTYKAIISGSGNVPLNDSSQGSIPSVSVYVAVSSGLSCCLTDLWCIPCLPLTIYLPWSYLIMVLPMRCS